MKKISFAIGIIIFYLPVIIFSQELNLSSGWNLKGTFLDNVSVAQFNNNEINSVWKWSNNSWLIWSPKNAIIQLINQYGINKIDKLNSGDGFWISVNGNITIKLTGDKTNSIILKIPSSGWFLKSSKVNSDISVEIFKNHPISTLWIWSGNSWKIWSDNENIEKLIENYGLESLVNIKQGTGFWINAISKFNIEFSIQENKCSVDNLTACSNYSDCKNAGGYWYNDMCNKKKHPVNIYVFDDNLQILKGVVFENKKDNGKILCSEGMLALTENNYNIEYNIKKTGYDNCSVYLNKTPKSTECFITDGYNYYVILADNRTDNKTMNFPLPYLTEFSSKELIQSLLIPAKPALKPVFSFDKNAYLLIKKMKIKNDYTVSLNLLSNLPESIYSGKGKPLFLLSVGIETSLQEPVDKLEGKMEVRPVVLANGEEANYKNIFLYEKKDNKWTLVSPVLFRKNRLIPLYYTENLTDYLFVQFSDAELTKIKGKVLTENGTPAIEALVAGSKSSVDFTDKKGEFEIASPETIDYLTACKTGYLCKTFNSSKTTVTLKKDSDIISEIPVEFYGETEKAVYNEPLYLENEFIITTINGKVYFFNGNTLTESEKNFDGYLYKAINDINNDILGITINGKLKIFGKSQSNEYNLDINADIFFDAENYYMFPPLTSGSNMFVPFISNEGNRIIRIKYNNDSDNIYFSLAGITNFPISGLITNITMDQGNIVFGTTEGKIYLLDNSSLKINNTIDVGGKITGKILRIKDNYICADWNGNIIKINVNSPENHTKIPIKEGLRIYNIRLLNNGYLALSTDKGVYILDDTLNMDKFFNTESDVIGDIYSLNGDYIFATTNGKIYKNGDVIADVGNKITSYKAVSFELVVFTELGEVMAIDFSK